MAIGFGFVWGIIKTAAPFLYLNFLLVAGFGYAIGEVISVSVNRKRGVRLAIIAGTCLLVSYLISLLSSPLGFHLFHPLDLLALALGIYIAVTRLR